MKSQILTYPTMNRTECYCLTFKFPTVRKMTARWGDMEGWRSPICSENHSDCYTGIKNEWITHGNNVSGSAGGHRTGRAFTQQILMDAPMPVTDDILERTRHLNDLKSMAEKTILQAFVLVLLTYTQYQLPF